MPLSIHGAYIPSNPKNPLFEEKPMDMPLTTSNHGVDPRFSFCSYSQAFPSSEHSHITQGTPAVINIFGQLNGHTIMEENAYKFSNNTKKLNNENALVPPCNCTSTIRQPYVDIENKEDKSPLEESQKHIIKNFNNNLEKKIRKETSSRYKFQNSIQPHSTNFHDIRVSLQTTSTYIVGLNIH